MTATEANFHEGIAALEARDLPRAIAAFTRALAADPSHTDARYRLANAYRDTQRLEDAEREIRTVIAQRPHDPQAHSALGVILMAGGRADEAVAAYAAAMTVDPAYVTAASNWLNAQHYVDGVTAASLAHAHAKWAALHAPAAAAPTFTNDRRTDRPIVVGFVSPDLSRHPVGLLSVKIFENFDPMLIQAKVFSTRPPAYEDDISRRIAHVTQWTAAFGLSDAMLAKFIQASKVDILVDMTGHTAHGRLKMFAMRAAPVQVGWLGYPGTTGLTAMDYLLCTDALAPPGTETFTVERIARLAHTHACFEPQETPPVGPLPFEANGYITFGCFNNPAKLSADAIAAFAAILARVPGSRLKMSYSALEAPSVRARLHALFAAHGIAPDRLTLSAQAERTAFLSSYNAVDIALDTFPYSGCMTTCEALWMGCPVITFPGDTIASRQSASILAAAGLARFIAPSRSAYQDLAVELSQAPQSLATIRADLRPRLKASALCDGAIAARDFTQAMQTIWAGWRDEPRR